MRSGTRRALDAQLIADWMADLQRRWLPQYSHSFHVDKHDRELIALVPAWSERLTAALTHPSMTSQWDLDPLADEVVQVTDGYMRSLAMAVSSALTIPADPDIGDAQPMLLATALLGAATLLEVFHSQLHQHAGGESEVWRAERDIALAAANVAVDLGSERCDLATVTRAAADVADSVAENYSSSRVVTILRSLADVVQPAEESDELRRRYEIECALQVQAEFGGEFPDRLRQALSTGLAAGQVIEIDLEPMNRSAQSDSAAFWLRATVRSAGPVVEVMVALAAQVGGTVRNLRIEVR